MPAGSSTGPAWKPGIMPGCLPGRAGRKRASGVARLAGLEAGIVPGLPRLAGNRRRKAAPTVGGPSAQVRIPGYPLREVPEPPRSPARGTIRDHAAAAANPSWRSHHVGNAGDHAVLVLLRLLRRLLVSESVEEAAGPAWISRHSSLPVMGSL